MPKCPSRAKQAREYAKNFARSYLSSPRPELWHTPPRWYGDFDDSSDDEDSDDGCYKRNLCTNCEKGGNDGECDLYNFYAFAIAKHAAVTTFTQAATIQATVPNDELKNFFYKKYYGEYYNPTYKGPPVCITSKMDLIYPDGSFGKSTTVYRWEQDLQQKFMVKNQYHLIAFDKLRPPEKCRGCLCLHPDAYCEFYGLTTNIALPTVMTKSERKAYFDDKVRESHREDDYSGHEYYLGMPQCIRDQIRDNIFDPEDLIEPP
jgi:hypothetical protein